jgi:hypothetical protein
MKYLITADAGSLDGVAEVESVGVYFYTGVDGFPGEYYRVPSGCVTQNDGENYWASVNGESYPATPIQNQVEGVSIKILKAKLLRQDSCWDAALGVKTPRPSA